MPCVYVVRCGVTLNPMGVYEDLESAKAACRGDSFVDRFVLNERRREPNAFDDVYTHEAAE